MNRNLDNQQPNLKGKKENYENSKHMITKRKSFKNCFSLKKP